MTLEQLQRLLSWLIDFPDTKKHKKKLEALLDMVESSATANDIAIATCDDCSMLGQMVWWLADEIRIAEEDNGDN